MPGIGINPPLIIFGVEASMQNSVQLTLFNAESTDDNITALGTTAATSYPIHAANTRFTTVAAGTGAVLPPTVSGGIGGFPLAGLSLDIVVDIAAANNLIVYPHPNDVGGTINAVSSVVLIPGSITPFQVIQNGRWFADSIGTGASGSLETIGSQGNIASSGTSQGTATVITQAMANVSSGGGAPAGVTLPVAARGLQVAIAVNNGTGIQVYGNGSDTINGIAGATGIPEGNALIVLYYCFTAGAWLTK
jgi:hypothetical protein